MTTATLSKNKAQPVEKAKKTPRLSDELDARMDRVLAGIDVGKGERKKDSDPLDDDDIKGNREYARIVPLLRSCRIVKPIFAWKKKMENTERKRGDGRAEDAAIAKRLGVSGSTVRSYYPVGRAAHVLHRSGVTFRNLPKSIDALAEFGKLKDEHIVDCYKKCKAEDKAVTANAAAESVAATMKEHPEEYRHKHKKTTAKKAARASYQAVFAQTNPTRIKFRVEKFFRAHNKGIDTATRSAMQRDMDEYKAIVQLYARMLGKKK